MNNFKNHLNYIEHIKITNHVTHKDDITVFQINSKNYIWHEYI